MPQSISDIRALLAGHGLSPKHRLGQNFLHDQNQLRRIVAAAEIAAGDVVLEVGPGTGTLTEALLEAGARVLAVEVDGDLIPILHDRVGGDAGVRVLHADILADKHTLNPDVVVALEGMGRHDFKLIANLPYQVASPLLVNLAIDHPGMSMAIVMVQREVADRLTASPGARDKAYGPLGIIIQTMCEVERLFTLPPSCYWPAPKVESAVVRMARRERALTADPRGFARFVHRLFQSRRKQIGAVMGGDCAFPEGIDRTMRAEELTIGQLLALGSFS